MSADLATSLGELMAGAPETMAAPEPVWQALLEAGTMTGPDTLFVARYEDVKRALQDSGSGRFTDRYNESKAFVDFRATLSGESASRFDEFYDFVNDFMVRQGDPEGHDRLRRVVHRAFTPRAIATLRESTVRYTDAMLAELADRDSFDVMEVAYRVPLQVIVELLGCPAEDGPRIHAWSMAIAGQLDRLDTEALAPAVSAIREFSAYVERILADHPAGAEDLLGTMLEGEAAGLLSRKEVVAQMVVLLFAGHETTTSLIGNGLYALLGERDQWEALCADQALVPNGVEELLRWVTPVQWVPRVVAEDHEIAGIEVSPGSMVILALAAANRDREVFDDPQRLDVGRADARRNLGFGFGPKFCLGASLARLEAEVVIGSMARSFPTLRLAVAGPLPWTGHPLLRRLDSLPVERG